MGYRTLVAKAMGHPSDEPGRVSRHRRQNTKKNLSRARRILDHEMEVSHDEE